METNSEEIENRTNDYTPENRQNGSTSYSEMGYTNTPVRASRETVQTAARNAARRMDAASKISPRGNAVHRTSPWSAVDSRMEAAATAKDAIIDNTSVVRVWKGEIRDHGRPDLTSLQPRPLLHF